MYQLRISIQESRRWSTLGIPLRRERLPLPASIVSLLLLHLLIPLAFHRFSLSLLSSPGYVVLLFPSRSLSPSISLRLSRRSVVPVPAGIDSRWRPVTAPALTVCRQSTLALHVTPLFRQSIPLQSWTVASNVAPRTLEILFTCPNRSDLIFVTRSLGLFPYTSKFWNFFVQCYLISQTHIRHIFYV